MLGDAKGDGIKSSQVPGLACNKAKIRGEKNKLVNQRTRNCRKPSPRASGWQGRKARREVTVSVAQTFSVPPSLSEILERVRQEEKRGGRARRGAHNQKAGFLRVWCDSGEGVVHTQHSLTRWEIQGHDRQRGRESECFECRLENNLEINGMLISWWARLMAQICSSTVRCRMSWAWPVERSNMGTQLRPYVESLRATHPDFCSVTVIRTAPFLSVYLKHLRAFCILSSWF